MTHRYECVSCGATGVKLWRLYSSGCFDLRCWRCAAKKWDYEITIDPDGMHVDGNRTSPIGFHIPAVPCGETYWGFGSIPEYGWEWWKSLPNEPKPILIVDEDEACLPV